MDNFPKGVYIYFGPSAWFFHNVPKEYHSIVDIAFENDSFHKSITIRGVSDEQPRPSYVNVVASADDYSSLNAHVIQNFIGFLREFDGETLYLHNPPTSICKQIERVFPSVRIEPYAYQALSMNHLELIDRNFSDTIIGQDRVKSRLLAALYPVVKQSRTKPLVLMFYGPSGVGKTETAKYIASLLDGKLLRKQFSMFQTNDFASYLFGGNHSESSFAKDLLNRESNVILIDEFDKSNPVFHSAFYQIFDEGLYEDKNYHLSVEHAIIICTSNYTSEDEIRENLGDPIFSRFSAIIPFLPLAREAIRTIIERTIEREYNGLESDEQSRIDFAAMKEKLTALADTLKNVREIQRLVNEVFSLHLVRCILGNSNNS